MKKCYEKVLAATAIIVCCAAMAVTSACKKEENAKKYKCWCVSNNNKYGLQTGLESALSGNCTAESSTTFTVAGRVASPKTVNGTYACEEE